MSEDHLLEKTNRINLLFDFYEPLLTEKQQTFLKHYYQDDFSLGEIAESFQISRQAVFEHIKRAEMTLKDYEQKLGLLAKHELRMQLMREMESITEQLESNCQHQLKLLIDKMIKLD